MGSQNARQRLFWAFSGLLGLVRPCPREGRRSRGDAWRVAPTIPPPPDHPIPLPHQRPIFTAIRHFDNETAIWDMIAEVIAVFGHTLVVYQQWNVFLLEERLPLKCAGTHDPDFL